MRTKKTKKMRVLELVEIIHGRSILKLKETEKLLTKAFDSFEKQIKRDLLKKKVKNNYDNTITTKEIPNNICRPTVEL